MRTLAVTGGVGGAKLCLGLAHELPPEDALFVVNTGDDFRHLGLTICPDIDTLTYTRCDRWVDRTGSTWATATSPFTCCALIDWPAGQR